MCNQPGTVGTTLLLITLGTTAPATPSGPLWTRFYCHKRFVQEQQYPPEGAVLSSVLRLHPLGAKDAFAVSPLMVGVGVAPGSPQSDRRSRGQSIAGSV